MIKKLCQIVDTIKLHLYLPEEINTNDYDSYVKFVEELKGLKDEAQKIHHSNNDMRFINYKIGSDNFRVMATTFRGFTVTLKNQDVSISFKSPKIDSKKYDENNQEIKQDIKKNNHTHSPVVKVEFRASFLARVGHVSAMQYVNEMLSKWVLKEYTLKVSEIHLATDIQGYDFTELDYFRFKTLKKTNEKFIGDDNSQSVFYTGREFTGFSFGKGSEMMRIYNKTVEISKNPDKAFIKHLAWIYSDYDEDKTVWRIEYQIRREVLKTLYTSVEGLLDGFNQVINSIPDLWGRALKVVEHKDMNDEHCLDMIRKYTMKDGVPTIMTKEAIKKRYQRADMSKLWLALEEWNGYVPKEVEVDKAPKTSSFQWVSNSIKSLLTTLLRYDGNLSPQSLEDAFVRSDLETMKDKGITLIDSAYDKTITYLANHKKYESRNGVYYPVNKILENNLGMYVHEIALNLYDDNRYSDQRATYLTKALKRIA